MAQSVTISKPPVRLPGKGRSVPAGPGAGLRAAATGIACAVAAPILVILFAFSRPEPEVWHHIAHTLLGDLAWNTALLCTGVLAGTGILGVGLAWLTSIFDFPGRRVFDWALLLPLAFPTYVLAFVFIGLFDFSGPVQTLLRSHLPGLAAAMPDIRSPAGVVGVMSLALYPYVYLLARSAFGTQGVAALEVSQAFGHSRFRAFFTAALPMARPWIAGGLLLVLMETLSDFGAVSIFNYDTFTTGIYKAWFGFFSIGAAAQLSSVLLAVVLAVIVAEQRTRRRMRFHPVGRAGLAGVRIPLAGWRRWTAASACTAVAFTAVVLPLVQLSSWSLAALRTELTGAYVGLLARSLVLGLAAAAVVTALGLLLAYAQRRHGDPFTRWTLRVATMGYALPGTVLAVGVAVMVGFLDRQAIRFAADGFGVALSPVLQGSLLTMVFAYAVRFLAAGYNAVGSAMERVTKHIDDAARLLGASGLRLIREVHVPILRNGLVTSAILVFVDVMKEMPITLMTRPFGWDTLAVKVFELTSEGEWQRAALPSVVLVLAGLLPLILLNRSFGSAGATTAKEAP